MLCCFTSACDNALPYPAKQRNALTVENVYLAVTSRLFNVTRSCQKD